MRGLEGRVAVITGGGDGIGRGTALRLAQEGAQVFIADINEDDASAVAAEVAERGGTAAAWRTDVCQRDEVEAMVDAAARQFGTVDILVNNAWAGTDMMRLEDKTDGHIFHGFNMNVNAAFWAMKRAFPMMKARRWGRIISVCSLNGVNAHMYSAEYNIGKEGLRALTRTAAREWASHGITANIVCPGAKSAAYRRFEANNPDMAAAIAAQNPIGRMGDPEEDIAPVIAFLASEDSRYMTGNTIFVDGGGHINGVAWAPTLPEREEEPAQELAAS